MPVQYEEIRWNALKFNNRNELRKSVVIKFMEETPGKGNKDLATRYKYIVEDLEDGRKIYLKRPAWNKGGFDFQIWVENWNNSGKDIMPSHDDILEDMEKKLKEGKKCFKDFLDGIEKVFNCDDDKIILELLNKKGVSFIESEKIDLILKVIKWMFIEQDIRYWNFSGRGKLKSVIDEKFKNI